MKYIRHPFIFAYIAIWTLIGCCLIEYAWMVNNIIIWAIVVIIIVRYVILPTVIYRSLPYYERAVNIDGKEIIIYRGHLLPGRYDLPYSLPGYSSFLSLRSFFFGRSDEDRQLEEKTVAKGWKRFQRDLRKKEERIIRRIEARKGTG